MSEELVEHNKSFEEGFNNGFSEGRETGLDYGRIEGLELCIAILQEKLKQAHQELTD
jgi:hypothetical protein